MNQRIVVGVFVFLTGVLSSCEDISTRITPSDKISTETRNVNDFTGIKVSDAFDVYITYSNENKSVEIEANENLQECIEVYKEGDNLVIELEDKIHIRNGKATLKAYLTSDYLNNFDISGASTITMHNALNVKDCTIELSGASDIRGTINADKLYADISGASELSLSGTTRDCYMDISGASEVNDYGWGIDYLSLELSGASNAYLTVNKELGVDASGASTIEFKGNGRIMKQDISGASTVKRR